MNSRLSFRGKVDQSFEMSFQPKRHRLASANLANIFRLCAA